MGAFCLLLSFYAGCGIDQDRLARPTSAPAPEIDAPPPPAEAEDEAALYQELFAGETSDEARAWGQRARMLAWFRYMELTDEQLVGLSELSEALGEREQRIAEARAITGEAELGALTDGYGRAIELLATGRGPLDEDLEILASDLSAARADAGAAALLRVRHTELRGMLDDTQRWISTLDTDQQAALGTSRFLLRHQVGTLTAPGDHGELLGTMWDGMAFDSLMLARVPDDTEPLDIGGLWATEKVRGTPDQRLSTVQRRVLALLAARQEGLLPAIEVARGTREPLDGLPQPADTGSP